MGSIEQGAKNAVEICMGVKRGERVLIVTDDSQVRVGSSLKDAAENVTGKGNVRLFVLEKVAKRPLTALPKEIDDAIQVSEVTFWAAQSLPGELGTRHNFIDKAKKYARHGHMPNITATLMEQGMCADYDEVYQLTHRVYEFVKGSKAIEVSNDVGTELKVEFDSSWRWVPSDGRYHLKGKWGNLPEGETFTAPKKVNGRLATNLLGDWFSEKYGNFKETLSLSIRDSMIEIDSVRTTNPVLKSEITKYLSTDQNSRRASEFALPTNPLLISLPTIGNLLQDEKARVHIAFGDPYPDETGANWQSSTHVDMLLERCDVSVDGRALMRSGKYVI